MASDIPSSTSSGPRIRVRMPAGGMANQATTVSIDPLDQGVFTNWFPAKEWSVTDDVLNVADALAVSLANSDGEHTGRFTLGQKVIVEESDPDVAGGQWLPQFTGRITAIETASDIGGGSVLLLSGMDLGWHLTTCHAKPLTKTQHTTIDGLFQAVIDPSWGLGPVVAGGNTLNRRLKQGRAGASREYVAPLQKQALPYFQIEPGQTPWQALQMYAQREGFLLNVGAMGELILFQPDYLQPASYSVDFHKQTESQRESNNIIGRPTLRQSIEGVYSQTQCWSTVVNPLITQRAEAGFNPNAAYQHKIYTPPSNPLPFNRLHVVSDPEAINATMMRLRAVWAYQMGQFQSWEYTVEFNAHSQNGLLFTSDTMISINDTVNQVSGTYYVQSVRRSLTMREGLRTRLTIRKPLLDPSLQAQVGGGAVKAAQPAPVKP
jgi:prophage tail gpP-like protein